MGCELLLLHLDSRWSLPARVVRPAAILLLSFNLLSLGGGGKGSANTSPRLGRLQLFHAQLAMLLLLGARS